LGVGDMTDELMDFIKDNNFALYGVVPNDAKDRTLYPDKISNVLPLSNNLAFYLTTSGNILKKITRYGSIFYVPVTEGVGNIKDVVTGASTVFYLMEDGTVQIYNATLENLVPLEGVSNVAKIYNFPSFNQREGRYTYNNSLYILDNDGKVFYWENNKLTPFNNTVVIKNIFNIGPYRDYNNIYVDENGVPYMEYTRYSYSTGDQKHLLTRAKIKNGDIVTNMPAIKDAEYFIALERTQITAHDYYNAYVMPVLILKANGTIHQFSGVEQFAVDSGTSTSHYYYLTENTDTRILETNVDSIDSNGICIFVFKKDKSVRMVGTDLTQVRIEYDDDYYNVMVPVPKNETINVPLTNIVKSYHAKNTGKYFFWDNNNNVYMYSSLNRAQDPVIGTTLINLGNNIAKVISNFSYNIRNFIYILYNDQSVREYGIYPYSLNYEIVVNKLLAEADVKNIYVSGNSVWLLDVKGGVKHKTNSSYNVPFTDVFENILTFDTTKTYYSLLDLFNEISNNKFYPAGGYATAFNDIYKNYNYSTSGNTYVVLGDDIKYESAYSDYENDPEYSRKWLISHDPYYFDNSMGLSAYHKPSGFTASPPVKLDKVGKYIINLKARDNPKSDLKFLNDSNEDKNYYKWSLGDHNLTVCVHRKPVALQRVSITNNGDGTYTVKAYDAGSYDPDHSVTGPDKGITAREWRWKEETSTVWTSGQMNKSDCTPDESYITHLRVKDVEGVWSDYAAITIDRNNPPAAFFTIDKTLISTSEWLKVKDMSFPQSFSSITDWHWIVKRLNADGSVPSSNIQDAKFTNSNTGTGTLAGYDKNVKYSYSSTGKYRIYLRVKDSNGLWSDGGADSAPVLDSFYSQDITVDSPPTASFTIEKNPIFVENTLQLRDTSTSTGISPVTRWHWIVKKLNADGSVPTGNIQNEIFNDSNTGTGSMAGYDVNVKTSYADKGPATYRIYLRVMNGNGMWSDGGTDSTYNLNSFFYEDLVVHESFKMTSFRVVRIRDFHLEPYYEYNGEYIDRPFYVNSMAIDQTSFMSGGISAVTGFSSLTKGYRFEFEIDTINFNEANDTIEIEPSFYSYTPGVPGVRGPQSDLYWEDSNKEIHKAGEGGHSSWARIVLDESSRTITGENEATWRGEYFIPATSWLVPPGTSAANAKANRINADIIVNFIIRGYRDGEMKYDYNQKQWPVERTEIKHPYEIGDVIRYDHTKSGLDDIDIIINRP